MSINYEEEIIMELIKIENFDLVSLSDENLAELIVKAKLVSDIDKEARAVLLTRGLDKIENNDVAITCIKASEGKPILVLDKAKVIADLENSEEGLGQLKQFELPKEQHYDWKAIETSEWFAKKYKNIQQFYKTEIGKSVKAQIRVSFKKGKK